MADITTALQEDLGPIVEGAGYRVVELHAGVIKGRTHVNIVVYRPEGVGIDDCAEIHRTLLPRVELLLDDRDVALQVASPGITRTFKDMSEFAVFTGRGVQVLLRDDDWIAGRIASVTDTTVELSTGEGPRTIAFDDIQKARLDHTQEVAKTDVK